MPIAKSQITILHVAKQQLGLADETYRDILMKVAGVSSAKDLDSWHFDKVMDYLGQMGFKSTSPNKPFGLYRAGMASNEQCRLIRRLWGEWTKGEGTDATLGKWLDHSFGITALRFLTAEGAHKAITALKAMTKRVKTGT